ncbi:MAG: hypothetical protein K5848_03255 [Lachnospiraceae bacterium]|nr:hypothetical protein [Lachnospiraceae bacterium]
MDNNKNSNTLLWILATIGAIVAIAGIAFAVVKFCLPDYLEDFDDFDDFDDIDDDLDLDDDEEEEKKDE